MELTGPEKAVLMLLSLEESVAAPIITELTADELRKLREVASMMREVPASSLESVYAEFLEKSQVAVAVPRGGVRYLQRVAAKALGEAQTAEIFVDGPRSAMDRLANADMSALAVVLENEHPQLVAAVLSQLPEDKACRLIEELPEARRPACIERLAKMTEVPAGLLEEVASALHAELPVSGNEALISVDGVTRSATLIRRMNRHIGDMVLGELANGDRALAEDIRRNMYSFEDLGVLDRKGLRLLLDSIPSERLTLALKTASPQLREKIFASMSRRAADRLGEEMELLGGVKLAEVEAAQREIVEQALVLVADGVISLEGDSDLV